MARADLILDLVRASCLGDKERVRKSVEALAANERAKSHTILADRLLAQLQVTNGYHSSTVTVPKSDEIPLMAEKVPQWRIEDLILVPDISDTVREFVTEHHRADLLRSYNLEPRNRVLLTEPPGNGKTTLAEALANELALPFFVVKYEALIGSYLGETAQKIARVMEHVRSRDCVLLFDEFESVGKERGDIHETGEIKRVVSSLLLQIDALPSYVIVVAASNHPELLDRAAWRRFQLRIELKRPTILQIENWFCRFEKRTGRSLGIHIQELANKLHGLSFAEIEDFSLDILRNIVIEGPYAVPKDIMRHQMHRWKHTFKTPS